MYQHKAQVLPSLGMALPDGYEGDFAAPRLKSQCCYVIRHVRGGTRPSSPRRCPSVRQRHRDPKGSDFLCCRSHAKHEDAAQAWKAAQG